MGQERKEIVLKVICNVYARLWSGVGSVLRVELKTSYASSLKTATNSRTAPPSQFQLEFKH